MVSSQPEQPMGTAKSDRALAPTYRLDRVLAERQATLEQERLRLLDQVLRWLSEQGSQYGIDRAYLFGSVTRPGQFTATSDVDMAVEGLEPERFFAALGALVTALECEVDLVELSKCPFADRIRQTGVLWTRTN